LAHPIETVEECPPITPEAGSVATAQSRIPSRIRQRVKRMLKPASRLDAVYRRLPAEGSVLDVGCLGFSQVEIAKQAGRPDLRHFGIDYCDRSARLPAGYVFRLADLNREPIPYDSESFDLVVASHVLEHLREPLAFVAECVRVAKPGGFIYVATPSERSLFAPGMFFGYEYFASLSFFDDPTHLGRPWTPQSLYRLAEYYECEAEDCGYFWSWICRVAAPLLLLYARVARNPVLFQQVWWYSVGWESYGVIRVPSSKRNVHFTYGLPPASKCPTVH